MALKEAPNAFDFPEGAAPATPDSSYVRLYAKTDGLLYSKDDAGTEAPLGGAGKAPNDATYIVQTADGDLTNEQALDALSDGLLKHASGVLAQAVANTDYAAATHASRHETGAADEIDGDKLDIDWTPSNYTPATTPTEADSADNLTAHLYGIDQILGTALTALNADNQVHKFATSQTTTSNTMVDVDATNAAVTITATGGGKALVICSFRGIKATAGSAYYRLTDGTNNSDESELENGISSVDQTIMWVFDTSAGSTTYKLQYRSDDANSAQVREEKALNMLVLEVA